MAPLYEQHPIYVTNSLSGKKELLKPLKEGYLGMYVCGPTVYSNVHLGNCRTFLSFDMIFRYFRHLGYKVRYVRNITDAGHLENDADEGEDKIAKKAKLEQLEPMEVVQRYTVDFHQTLEKLNFLPPSIEPTATGHIIEQIEIIKTIIEAGYAYEKNGSVYFDVIRFNEDKEYGKLSGRKLEDMEANTRELTAQSEKRAPQDFALWKKAEPKHIMRWPSPWGDGFPGWHLECTAMSTKYLGKEFDIHGGGMDLKFPHHECEIAQAEACNDQSPVRYWLHANMLTLNGKKMSKSTGNNIYPNEIFNGGNDLLSKTYSPSVVRFFMLQAHYTSILDLSDSALLASEKGYMRLMDGLKRLEQVQPAASSDFDVNAWQANCYKAMGDDFNTPILIAHLFEGIKFVNQALEGKQSINATDLAQFRELFNAFVFDVLGLLPPEQQKGQNDTLDGTIQLLIDLRNSARAERDFATSDQIRDRLVDLGVQLKDGKEGTTYSIE